MKMKDYAIKVIAKECEKFMKTGARSKEWGHCYYEGSNWLIGAYEVVRLPLEAQEITRILTLATAYRDSGIIKQLLSDLRYMKVTETVANSSGVIRVLHADSGIKRIHEFNTPAGMRFFVADAVIKHIPANTILEASGPRSPIAVYETGEQADAQDPAGWICPCVFKEEDYE